MQFWREKRLVNQSSQKERTDAGGELSERLQRAPTESTFSERMGGAFTYLAGSSRRLARDAKW